MRRSRKASNTGNACRARLKSVARVWAPRALLAMAIGLVLLATLLPDEPGGPVEWSQVFCLGCGRAVLADALSNLALFVPLGMALACSGDTARFALIAAAMLSVTVESAQFVIPGRDPSIRDVLFNTLGGLTGFTVTRRGASLLLVGPRTAARLSLVAATWAAVIFVATAVLVTPVLPETTYFGGSAELRSSLKPLRLGGNLEPDGHFQGRIDDVRIYRRARTPDEIALDMRLPVAANLRDPDLMAAYNFDEMSGDVLLDRSGHGNNGRIAGAAWTKEGHAGGALTFNGISDVVVIPGGQIGRASCRERV